VKVCCGLNSFEEGPEVGHRRGRGGVKYNLLGMNLYHRSHYSISKVRNGTGEGIGTAVRTKKRPALKTLKREHPQGAQLISECGGMGAPTGGEHKEGWGDGVHRESFWGEPGGKGLGKQRAIGEVTWTENGHDGREGENHTFPWMKKKRQTTKTERGNMLVRGSPHLWGE